MRRKRSRKNRRRPLRLIGLTLLSTIFFIALKNTGSDSAQEEPASSSEVVTKIITNDMSDIPELEGMDNKIMKFLKRWDIHGATVAIVRNDSLVYAKGYGWADEECEITMEPYHIMRVASVSKLITAAGIMVLQDQGKLTIQDKVFGPAGILNTDFFNDLTSCDPRYNEITVEDILRHRSGFYRDPVFSSIDVQLQMRLDHPPTKEDFFTLVLGRKLKAPAGERQKYSNFGYIVLSEIIEKVSGQKYEDFINEHVMKPAGCHDTHIGGIYYEDKRKNEVRYYTHDGDGKYMPDFRSPQDSVERSYGGTNLPLLSGAGAWCCSPVELARFVASINGNETLPDIISEKGIRQMTEHHDNAFSLGWNDTHPVKGWSRTGSLAGTSALIHHYPDGECWVFVTNTSTYRGYKFSSNIESLISECRSQYSSKLPDQNLFE